LRLQLHRGADKAVCVRLSVQRDASEVDGLSDIETAVESCL